MTTIKIVTDSTADLDPRWVERYDIQIVPAFVNFEDESFPDDGIAITRPDFYVRLAQTSKLPTTAAPPPGLAEEAFRKALEGADHVVALSVAAALSSIYDGMALAARNVDEKRITLVDSGLLSMGLGWQVLAAAESAASGASVEAIVAAANSVRRRTRLYAALDTMEYLRRSGRVSWAAASLGALLQIKPIVSVQDGKVESVARVRTLKKAFTKVAQLGRAEAPLERLAVLHSNAPDRAEQLREMLADIVPANYITITDVTTAIGTHVGPGGIGLATVQVAE